MDYFKKCFVINLNRRTDRYEEFLERIPFEANVCTRFSAIDGDDIKNYDKDENPYIIGCHLSHKAVLQNVINDNSIEDNDYVIIFEDDVYFQSTFIKEIEKIVARKNVFDTNSIIYIGGKSIQNFLPNNLTGYTNIIENIYLRNNIRDTSDIYIRNANVIILSKFACKQIINKTKHVRVSLPIDALYNKIRDYIPEMKIYDLFPHVCYSSLESDSDIEKFYVTNEVADFSTEHENDYFKHNDFIINEEPGIGTIGMMTEPIF